MLRRARLVMAAIVALVLLFLVPSFLLFGLLVASLHGDTMCGAIGHLRMPECDSVSWEFGLGAGSLLVVILALVSLSAFVCCVLPKAAQKRLQLRDCQHLDMGQQETP